MGLAWCNNTKCELKEDCKRYSEDKDIQYIRFDNIIQNDDQCRFFIKIPREVTVVEEEKETNE